MEDQGVGGQDICACCAGGSPGRSITRRTGKEMSLVVWNNGVPSLGDPASVLLLLPRFSLGYSLCRGWWAKAPHVAPLVSVSANMGQTTSIPSQCSESEHFRKAEERASCTGWGGMLRNIHSSFIPNSPTWETTHTLISREQEQTCSTVPPALCQIREIR